MEVPVNKLHAEMLLDEAIRKKGIALSKTLMLHYFRYTYEVICYEIIVRDWEDNIKELLGEQNV